MFWYQINKKDLCYHKPIEILLIYHIYKRVPPLVRKLRFDCMFDCICNQNHQKTFKIGATGFEPATSRPPAVRATKLRHTPQQKILYQHSPEKATVFLLLCIFCFSTFFYFFLLLCIFQVAVNGVNSSIFLFDKDHNPLYTYQKQRNFLQH